MDNENLDALEWSAWLNFDKETVTNIPESEGVYKMHESMKILFIGSSYNLKESLLESFSNSCLSKATRFSYAVITSSDIVKEFLLEEYRRKHQGKMPLCM